MAQRTLTGGIAKATVKPERRLINGRDRAGLIDGGVPLRAAAAACGRASPTPCRGGGWSR